MSRPELQHIRAGGLVKTVLTEADGLTDPCRKAPWPLAIGEAIQALDARGPWGFVAHMKDRLRDDAALASIAAVLLSIRDAAISWVSGRKKSDLRAFELIEDSALFDPQWYLRAYPDVAEARVNPLDHYMNVGWHEGRDPGPEFSTSAYLKANRDVAQSGVNPLLHFVEFGHQEGRGSSAHKPMRRQLPLTLTDFGAAAPCASFPLPNEQSIRWRRGYQLPSAPERFSAGECVVGLMPDQAMRANLELSFSLLRTLSGYDKAASGTEQTQLPRSAHRLLDAWYLTTEQLRTRWSSEDFPVIVRAFQHDPLHEGILCLVGEGLAASPIDAVDLHLRNPYFPVLIVFSRPDGTVGGAEMLAFPSLCRGGVHYSELLYANIVGNETNEVDPVGAGEALALRLLRLKGTRSPAVAKIEVEIDGGDGRGPLFQPDFQLWLEKVFKISVAAIGPTTSRAAKFLAEAVAIPPSPDSREGGAALILSHDMVPAIGILAEAKRGKEGSAAQAVVPFLVAGPDASQPALAIESPQWELPKVRGLQGRAGVRSPRLSPGPDATLPEGLPPAAIAPAAEHDMSDATLFVPIANATASAEARSPITWIVEAPGWPNGGLAQAVIALALQSGPPGDHLFFVGDPDLLAKSIARERISGGIDCFDDVETAIAAAPTGIVGYAAAGVLLHDTGTTSVLVSLLDDELVATVSCALVAVDQSAARWHATIADAGSFAMPPGTTLGRAERSVVNAYLWGSHYPVRVPAAHLWLARKASLTEWMERSPGQLANGVHICSSEVTASYIGKEPPSHAPAYIPAAANERTTQVRALFG